MKTLPCCSECVTDSHFFVPNWENITSLSQNNMNSMCVDYFTGVS